MQRTSNCTTQLCKPCQNLRDAQKSCINKYYALKFSWIISRCERFASQRFLDTDIWRFKDISSWVSYRETNKKRILKATKWIKKLITNIPFSHTQTMSTRTTQWASSTYSVWRTPHWLDLLFANTGQNKLSISSLKILMNSSPLPQAMKIFVTGFLQTK